MGVHADDLMFEEMGLNNVESLTYRCGYCKKKLGKYKTSAQEHVNDCEKVKND